MKLAIVGSRTFNDFVLLEQKIIQLYHVQDISCIVSGGANGADKLGEQFAKKYKISLSVHKPQWDIYGKRAGFVRNKEIVDQSDEIIAFWDGSSPGTKNTINLAYQSNKKIEIIQYH